jgi:RNA polymerase sigma factor (sigma-70 family)
MRRFLKALFVALVAFVSAGFAWELARDNKKKTTRTVKMNRSQRFYKHPYLDHIDENNQANRIRIRQLIVEKCELAKKLPMREKMLFLMYYDHGHTLKEIAGLCKMTEGQVSRRLGKIAEKINNVSEDEA